MKTPRTVPNGVKVHSIAATTMQKILPARLLSFLAAITTQIARVQPTTVATAVVTPNIHATKGGGAALLGPGKYLPETMA